MTRVINFRLRSLRPSPTPLRPPRRTPAPRVRLEATKTSSCRAMTSGSSGGQRHDFPALDLIHQSFTLTLGTKLERETRREGAFVSNQPEILNFRDLRHATHAHGSLRGRGQRAGAARASSSSNPVCWFNWLISRWADKAEVPRARNSSRPAPSPEPSASSSSASSSSLTLPMDSGATSPPVRSPHSRRG